MKTKKPKIILNVFEQRMEALELALATKNACANDLVCIRPKPPDCPRGNRPMRVVRPSPFVPASTHSLASPVTTCAAAPILTSDSPPTKHISADARDGRNKECAREQFIFSADWAEKGNASPDSSSADTNIGSVSIPGSFRHIIAPTTFDRALEGAASSADDRIQILETTNANLKERLVNMPTHAPIIRMCTPCKLELISKTPHSETRTAYPSAK